MEEVNSSVVRLRDVCLQTSLADPTKEPDKPFEYVDVSSISNETYTIVSSQRLLGSEAPSRARKLIRAGDVLFATVRPTLRRVALVCAELDGQIASTGYCVLRPDPHRASPEFIYLFLLTRRVAQTVDLLQKGATYPAISDSDLLALDIELPPLPEQRSIARVLRAVQDVTEARRSELDLERERKAALLAGR
jgi:type I restriction enzyme, S subunit